MRNPWASELYTGAWCDKCSEWNDQSKREAGWVDKDDGVFFMPLANYHSTFANTHFTKNITNWYNDYYLMINDQKHDTNPGRRSWCGSQCTRHELYISSDVTQTVYVTAHTWDERSMGDTCRDLWFNRP